MFVRYFDVSRMTATFVVSPERLVPPPRFVMGAPCSWHDTTVAMTSSMSSGCTTPSGGRRKFEESVDQTARAPASKRTSPRTFLRSVRSSALRSTDSADGWGWYLAVAEVTIYAAARIRAYCMNARWDND